MTSLLSVRKRSVEFAVAVDGGPDVTSLRPELRQLVSVAALLRAQPTAIPRADFALNLREQLMAEAVTVLTPTNAGLALPVRQRGARERRLVAVAASMVLLGGTASMAAAAQKALPGEALYPIKRGIEQAQAGLSMSSAGKGRDLLNQANDRLDEVQGLLSAGSLTSRPEVPQTLDEFTQQADEGANLMLKSYQDTHDPSTIVALRQFAADGITVLAQIADTAPPEANNELTTAALAMRDIDERASQMCSTCAADLPSLKVPKMFLVSAEADRALHAVKGMDLDNSHPVVVPRSAVTQAGHTAGGTTNGATGPASGTAGTPSSSATSGAGSNLPNTHQTVKGKSDADKILNNPLSGIAETLLPDPTTPPQLP
jgi:Domain of unknown function (DUF5667)